MKNSDCMAAGLITPAQKVYDVHMLTFISFAYKISEKLLKFPKIMKCENSFF